MFLKFSIAVFILFSMIEAQQYHIIKYEKIYKLINKLKVIHPEKRNGIFSIFYCFICYALFCITYHVN